MPFTVLNFNTMNEYTTLPKLSRDYILERVTQEQIFTRYTGLKVQYDYSFTCKLWEDSNPDCRFEWSNHRLRLHDYGGHFWGDCFDLVAWIYAFNLNSKTGFIQVLDQISKDFRLHKYEHADSGSLLNYAIAKASEDHKIKLAKETSVIKIQTRDLIIADINYWKKYHVISDEILNKYNVYPTQTVWLNDNPYYHFTRLNDLCYSYFFGINEIGIDIMKAYFVNRKTGKFLMNIPTLEGLRHLSTADTGIITKSYKDVMCINELSLLKGFSCEAVALPSETHLIKKETIFQLKTKYNHLVSLMDFDLAGRKMAWQLKTLYDVPSLFFTNGKVKTKNYGTKDFSDYLQVNGIDNTARLMEHSYNYILKKYGRDNNQQYELFPF